MRQLPCAFNKMNMEKFNMFNRNPFKNAFDGGWN